ncbi:hypothetical protein FSP39_004980 [Pinctada imbricata]|uniref:Amidohydrolase-related domain-containing protein n=1 Tax=Pinctada imbricata TaxID=66713 RepID=A0AA89C8X8_PINIB|nr:hypothetical protein FSP39_004980 [Pinctada imbricata]
MGPAYDLPSVMSKFLHLGMSLDDVIGAVTWIPAKAIGWDDRIGSLGIGREADITVLRLEDYNNVMEDSQSQVRHVEKILRPVAVWRRGATFNITKPSVQPNTEAMASNRKEWDNIIIRDAHPPSV